MKERVNLAERTSPSHKGRGGMGCVKRGEGLGRQEAEEGKRGRDEREVFGERLRCA